MSEMFYPVGVIMENILGMWAISRWRGSREMANFFLTVGYRYLPCVSLVMFHVEEVRGMGAIVIGLTARFINCLNSHFHDKVFWCGCEFIAFITYNIFTNLDNVFPTANDMHTLPYNTEEEE
ncbi:Auxin-induced protein 5NG4 [Hordeum vulgare]|nr:Auxin-induced protein 5NG4 [Hordeum vulgare]